MSAFFNEYKGVEQLGMKIETLDDFSCRESGYLIQNLIKIIKLFKPSGLYNMTMRVKLYGPFLYKKKGRTQHLTSVSSFTQQCFR